MDDQLQVNGSIMGISAQDFRQPPTAYREIPFWSWNDDLQPDELRRQIGLMQAGGWGGFFMHARIGLKTPYLSADWMACIRACVEEARQRGMQAWLYDEDQWPSGFAGGLSVAGRAENRSQYLVYKLDNRPALLEERLAAYVVRVADGQVVEILRPIEPGAAPTAPLLDGRDQRLLQFYVQTMPIGDPNWFNGFAYLNLLNPDAVRDFLASTHEAYRQEIGADFGKTTPGIFTDEPCSYFRVSRGASPEAALPWERRLPEIFQQRCGYDLLQRLPGLFFDVGEAKKTRYDFWRTVTHCFVTAYSQQIYQWCSQNNLRLTGHYMSEDTMLTQIQWGLAAAMPHYAYMQVPGIDKLGRQIGQIYGKILTVKQLDSAACQLGKPRALVENYACSAQDFAHLGRKWLGDWAAVLGANLHNPHLALYSLRGERKRDCPPNLFYQQPWWPENKLIADYTARLSYALSQGQRVTDILVIHPMGSAWALYKPGAVAGVEALDRQLDQLLQALLADQRDFHLGDETMMLPDGETPASVDTTGDLPRLKVGQMSYRLVIVPPCVTLARHTADLLARFAAAGGPVLAFRPLPTLLDGMTVEGGKVGSGEWEVGSGTDHHRGKWKVFEGAGVEAVGFTDAVGFTADVNEVGAALDECLPFDVRVAACPDRRGTGDNRAAAAASAAAASAAAASAEIWAHHRRAGETEIYFFANTSLDKGGEAEVCLRAAGRPLAVEEWDLASGEVRPVAVRRDEDCLTLKLDFPPVGSHLLVCRPTDAAMEAATDAGAASTALPLRAIELNGPWDLELCGPNSLTLDRAQIALPEGGWSQPMPILEAHARLAVQGVGASFALRFTFETVGSGKWGVGSEDEVFLAIEAPEHFSISVNGQALEAGAARGWWVDTSFRKLEITPWVQAGENEIVLRGVFRLDSELESLYLGGSFGVAARRVGEEGRHNGLICDRYRPPFHLVSQPTQAIPDPQQALPLDLTAAGLPFFTGRVVLRQRVGSGEWEVGSGKWRERGAKRVWLELEGLRAAVAQVRVNGQSCGSLAWQPFRVEIGAALQPGENLIEIELVNTLRNLLGPHHLAGGEKDMTGPGEYRDPRRWTDDYILVPFGFAAARLWEEQ